VIKDIKSSINNVLKNVHFLRDCTSQQYRNKNMFYLIYTFFQEELQCQTIRWHFTEKGHGKGAPDGVGGCVKRTADAMVAVGKDIPDMDTLRNVLELNCPGITILKVDESDFPLYEQSIPQDLKTFKGTLQVHEVCWSKLGLQATAKLEARRLSCPKCQTACKHYAIGRFP
jgi:hypothetical protein